MKQTVRKKGYTIWKGNSVYSDENVSITGSYTEYDKRTDNEVNRLYVSETTTQATDGMKWYVYLHVWKYGDDVSGSLLKPKTLLSAKRTFGLK
jgi:hypothetical protein